MSKVEFKSIKDFLFQKDKTFIIPNYQRGYKWAVKKNNKQSAVEKLIKDLINANKQQEYFLQGITVSEEDNNIILIDGQQRTTTLYLLLWALQYEKFKEINLQYDIREKSKEFINKLKNDKFDYASFDMENNIQDVFYFKEAIKQIKTEIEKIEDRTEFHDFLLDKVTVIYIVIDKDKATKTFTMINGSKATMLQEELVKAEMLRRISIPDIENKQVSSSVEDNLNDLKEIITKDWETNALRSRYAREWDKWLYWWNRNDVKEYFNIKSPMGLLLDYFYKRKKDDKDAKFSFDNFKGLITENEKTGKQKTKLIFKELRDLQKSFEDIFNSPKIYNYLKLALICSADGKDKFEIINYFINNKKNEELLANYSKWRMVGATHSQITSGNLSENEETKEDKAQIALDNLSDDFVYQNAYDTALKQLLRLNVEEDNKLFDGKGRKFDFTIYGNKSLEHIHPKSKVYHKNEEEKLVDGNNNLLNEEKTKYETDENWLNREDFNGNGTEHCIGNLVLLDKNENSKFNDKSFEEKKVIYFNVNEVFKSRNLLHTISVFAKSKWGIEDIQKNKEEFIKRFKTDYKITD